MPWNYDDAEINGIVDSSLKDAPPAAPMSNTAATVRALLKNMWTAMRGQVSQAVASIDATNASLVQRSLNLAATVYVDPVNGNDARIGTTNDNNAATGCVKTLQRVADLHSGKTFSLVIQINGVYNHAADVTLENPSLRIIIPNGASGIVFKKKTTGAGEGNYRLLCSSNDVFLTTLAGSVTVEASLGTDKNSLGALTILRSGMNQGLRRYGVINFFMWNGTLTLGTNAVFANSGILGTTSLGSSLDFYTRVIEGAPAISIDATATESTLIGDRTYHRQYHPTSSTDAKVGEGETVLSPTNNKLWTKRAGTIRDAMGTTFV